MDDLRHVKGKLMLANSIILVVPMRRQQLPCLLQNDNTFIFQISQIANHHEKEPVPNHDEKNRRRYRSGKSALMKKKIRIRCCELNPVLPLDPTSAILRERWAIQNNTMIPKLQLFDGRSCDQFACRYECEQCGSIVC